jgi:hypothetical protein
MLVLLPPLPLPIIVLISVLLPVRPHLLVALLPPAEGIFLIAHCSHQKMWLIAHPPLHWLMMDK